jgi:hypothetical protein
VDLFALVTVIVMVMVTVMVLVVMMPPNHITAHSLITHRIISFNSKQ